jgi:HSP20 family protein
MSEKDHKEKGTGTEKKVEATFDLGFGGLFRGLGDLVDLVSKMATEGEELVSKQQEFRIKTGEEEARAVYGFSVRMGVGGIPRVERFGNVRPTEEGPVVAEVREPMVDLFDEESEILVVVEMPGVVEEEIQVEIREDILAIESHGSRRYGKEILLPAPVDAATLEQTYRNGILEIRLKKR